MVPVIVDHRHAAADPLGLEAPADPAEAVKGPCDAVGNDSHLQRHRDRGEAVLDIMLAKHREAHARHHLEPAGGAVGQHHIEQHRRPVDTQVDGAHIGVRRHAVGDDPPVLDPGHQALHRRMVDTQGGKAVEGNGGDEIQESLLQRIIGAVMVEMLRIDIGDHGDGRVQLGERTVALVGLDNHPLAAAKAGIASPSGDDAAIDYRRIDAGAVQQGRHQRGGRRLAMCAGNGD